MMTGFHAAHVVVGLILLAALLIGAREPAFIGERRAGAEGIMYYWHFVFIVWVGIWATIYLVR
jgi:cytochrome c oxidase subunit 3